jgi:hypothetical protein
MATRYRTKGLPLISRRTQQFYSTWNNPGCNSSEQVDGSVAYDIDGDLTQMWDAVTPDFKKRQANGDIIMSPLTRRIDRVVSVPGNGNTRTRKTSHLCGGISRNTVLRTLYWQGCYAYLVAKGNPSPSAPYFISPPSLLGAKDISNFLTEKSTELANKRGRPDHDIWESLAELDKTAALLPGLFKSLRKAIPVGKRSDLQKSISDVWLAYRYGVKPLVGDIEGVLKGMREKVGKIRKTYRSNGSFDTKSFESLQWLTATYGQQIGANYTDKVTVRCTSIDEFEASLAFNIGFSSKGLITLPWELTKYSFVIDWFANVGDFLGAATPSLGFNQLGSCISVFRERDITLTHLGDIPGADWNITVPSNGQYYSYVGEYSRGIGTPAPGIVIRNNFRFNHMTRAADALALLISKLKG